MKTIGKEKNHITQLIQLVYDFDNIITREREINALATAMTETDCQSGLILTDHHEKTLDIDHKKIVVLPVYQWLLNK